jgi:hypothetical protein
MSEDTMNFYQYNLDIKPGDTSHYAVSYLMKILNILLKWNKDVYKEISKQLKKAASKFLGDNKAELLEDLSCEQIVEQFNNFCSSISEAEQIAQNAQA